MPPQGLFKWHQYQVVGRHLPTEHEPVPTVYRMKVWAEDSVKAKSKFWYAQRAQRSICKEGTLLPDPAQVLPEEAAACEEGKRADSGRERGAHGHVARSRMQPGARGILCMHAAPGSIVGPAMCGSCGCGCGVHMERMRGQR